MSNSTKIENKASVCIPVYNGEEHLASAIESALNQEYRDFELIIIDDCSTDFSAQIVEGYKQKVEKLRFYQNAENLGITRNWNKCLEKAQGEYVVILHQDDELLPYSLKKQVAVLEKCPEVGLVFGNAEVIYLPQGRRILHPGWTTSFKIKGRDFAVYMLSHLNSIYCPTVMLRRERLKKHGFFDEYFEIYEDYEMWLRLALQGVDFAFLPVVLAKYKYHQTNASKRVVREGLNIRECQRVATEHESEIKSIYGQRAEQLLQSYWRTFSYLCLGYALNLIYNGHYEPAKRQLQAAIEFYPKYKRHLIVQALRTLSRLGFPGRILVVAIEETLRKLGLRRLLERQTYPTAMDLPANITKLDEPI